jgi:uncharacterized membrane protein
MGHLAKRGTWPSTLGLAAVAGMRTMLAPAFVFGLKRGRRRRRSPWPGRLLALMAASEFLIDKLPGTPDRTRPAGIIGRMASGALVAGARRPLRRRGPAAVAFAAAVGAVTALAATFVSHRLRRALASHLQRRPVAANAVLGAAEDLLALGLGRVFLGRRV